MLIQYVDDLGLPFYYETTTKHFARIPSQSHFVTAKTPLDIFNQVPVAVVDESKQQRMVWYKVQLNNGDEFYFDPKENVSHWILPEHCKEVTQEQNNLRQDSKEEIEEGIEDEEFEIMEDENAKVQKIDENEDDEFEVMDMETGEIVELESEIQEEEKQPKLPEIAPPSKIIDFVSGKIISKEGTVDAFEQPTKQSHTEQIQPIVSETTPFIQPPIQAQEQEQEIEEKEYSTLSQDEKVRVFKQLLIEKNIPSFAKWDTSVLKLRSDKRYRVLNNLQQKRAIFDLFVQNKDLEIQKEKTLKKKEAVEGYKQLLLESFTNSKIKTMNFRQFSEGFGNEKRFIELKDSREKEVLFYQFQKQSLETKKKIQTKQDDSIKISTPTPSTKINSKKEAIEQFKLLLAESILQYDAAIKYEHIKESLSSDPRFDDQQLLLKDSEKRVLFQQYFQKLKQQQQQQK